MYLDIIPGESMLVRVIAGGHFLEYCSSSNTCVFDIISTIIKNLIFNAL